jgi:hypothetical protein
MSLKLNRDTGVEGGVNGWSGDASGWRSEERVEVEEYGGSSGMI